MSLVSLIVALMALGLFLWVLEACLHRGGRKD
jgi:hypothetical protein